VESLQRSVFPLAVPTPSFGFEHGKRLNGGLPVTQIFLRRPQVEARTGLKRSTIYQRIRDGTFPKPVRIGPRAVAWLETDVSQWQAAQVAASRGE
jgi:prophage regulatory protein